MVGSACRGGDVGRLGPSKQISNKLAPSNVGCKCIGPVEECPSKNMGFSGLFSGVDYSDVCMGIRLTLDSDFG